MSTRSSTPTSMTSGAGRYNSMGTDLNNNNNNNNNDRRYRLDPGIVLNENNPSTTIDLLAESTQQQALPQPQPQQQSMSRRITFIDKPNKLDQMTEYELERIMNTSENQDHLLIQSMQRGISLMEYKHELMLKLCGK